MSTYGFRLRFFVHGPFLDTDESSLELALPDGAVVTVLASDRGQPLRDVNDLQIRGQGFASAEEARACGERLRNAIRKSSVELQIGFDLGKDVATSSADKVVKEQRLQEGVRLLDDVHGLCVYDEDLDVRVLRMKGAGTVIAPPAQLLTEWQRQYQENPVLTPREVLALELYSAAHKEPFVRAKFLTLISVVEVLAQPGDRSEAVRDHIQRLIDDMKNSGLSADEQKTIVQQLHHLKKHSIRSSCRAYIGQVLGKDAWDEFDRFYEIRSTMTHDGDVPPGVALSTEATTLDAMVAKLLKHLGRP